MKSILQSGLNAILSVIIIGLFASFTGNENPKNSLITGGLLTFTVRTVTDNGTYSPKHVLAIWVEDSDGFVKTRKAMANQRKQYLYTWKAASNYNVVDAITGSTLNSHQTHTITWNCTDLSGNIVPDGDYTVWVEFTDKHAQGPLYSLTFTKGLNTQSINPADQTYFKDIQLDFIPLAADFSSDVTNICQGESVTFTDMSVGASSWNWNFGTGASPASANSVGPHAVTYNTPGNKTVSLTINGSITETKQNMITVNASPTADFGFSGIDYNVEFANYSVNATSYLWDFGDGFTSIDNNPTHTFSDAGTYSVSLTAYFLDCSDYIAHDVSVPVVGINPSPGAYEQILLYPNPTDDVINFNVNLTGNITIRIFNVMGKEVNRFNFVGSYENNPQSIDLSNLPKGIYFMNLENTNLKINQKIILY